MNIKKYQKLKCAKCNNWAIDDIAYPCNKCKETNDDKGSKYSPKVKKGLYLMEIKKGMRLRNTHLNEICHVVGFTYNPYTINKEKIVLVKNCNNKEYMTHPSNLEKIK